MNLLCPNCQKPLTVPEQYAGQPMRCPLCQGTFTVPALPPSSAPPPAPPPPATSPAEATDVYGFQDPGAPPVVPPAPPPASGAPGPAPVTGAPPPPRPPSGPPPAFVEEEPTYPTIPTPEGYQRKYTVWFSPKVLMYVAPVAVFLICILTCFAWTGVYPGRVPAAWQNAWQAIYGGWSYDPDVSSNHPPFAKGYEPGWNFLLIIYMLLLFPTLLVTFACLLLAFVPTSKLPPAAQQALHQALPWRWVIVAAFNLILLLFLLLQLALGFSLENRYIAQADDEVAAEAKDRTTTTTPEARADAIRRGEARQTVSRTIWLDLVVLLSILAVAAAVLMFWLTRRGGRPAPQVNLLW